MKTQLFVRTRCPMCGQSYLRGPDRANCPYCPQFTELKTQIQSAATELAVHVQPRIVHRILRELERLTAGEIRDICLCSQPPGLYPMRGAKVLLQVVGEAVIEDFNAEAIRAITRKTKRILRNRA